METRAQIGWIGLGSMGSRMAPNLVKNGYDVTGFDIDPERIAIAASQELRLRRLFPRLRLTAMQSYR